MAGPFAFLKTGTWSRRVRTIGLIAIALGAFLAWALRPIPVPADFADVTRGDLMVTIDDEGETRVRDIYIVSAPVAGRIERIELEVGDPVLAGQTVLARFQPQDPALLDVRSQSEAEAGVRLAEAEQDRAAAQLEFAQSDLRRQQQLVKEGTVSQAAFDRARLQVKTAQADLAQAVANVTKRKADLATSRAALAKAGRQPGAGADINIDYIPVRAPVDGRLLRRMQQSESILTAGTPLLEIGDPRNLEIVTDLLSADAVRVKVGNPVLIEDWGGTQTLQGSVKRIEPFGFTKVSALGIEEQRVNVIIDFTSPAEDWKSLGHGYRVQSRIIIEKKSNVLKVPVSALFRTGADWSVFTADSGIAHLRVVTLGSRNTLEAEIAAGVKEGDKVLVHPSDQIRDGSNVAARE